MPLRNRLILSSTACIVLASACAAAHAQCSYGSQCGRTIYEEASKQREHDRYISQQSTYNTSYSNNSGSSRPSIPSWTVKVPPSRDYRKETREFNNRSAASAPSSTVHTRSLEEYFAELKRDTARNVAGAKDKLALAYYWGDGTAANKAEAFRLWKEMGATNGDAEMTAAGMLYGGDGVPKDEAGGIAMARLAAGLGNAAAKAFLAGAQDTPESVERESKAGNNLPMGRYGWELLYGKGDYAKDEVKGFAYLKRAAEGGEPRAETNLGFAYMFGAGTPENNAEATKWFLKAAAQKEEVAAYQLAWLYVDSGRPGGKDIAAARKWSDVAMAAGPEQADNIYQRGTIELAAKDEAKARALFLKAGLLGDPVSLGQAAIMEWRGDGGDADFSAGHQHMLASAKAGVAVSSYELGNAYQKGIYGLEKNPPHATELFQAAADKGLVQAEQNLAMAYYMGDRGVPKSQEKAAMWATKAAEAGYPGSQYMIACLYHDGSGVATDPEKALYWMKKAADNGDAAAKQEVAGGYTGR